MLRNVKEKRLFEKVVDEIKDSIQRNELKAGDKLPSELELSKIFGVSRSAIREALRILELSGLIVIKLGVKGGSFIGQIEQHKKLREYLSDHLKLGNITIVQLTEARYWVETMILDIVGQKISKKDLVNLRASAENAEKLFRESRSIEKHYELWNFHQILAAITKNSILIDTLSSINEILCYMMLKIETSRPMTESALRVHRELVDLIEQGKIEEAKKINKKHIQDVSQGLIKKYQKDKDMMDFL